MGHPLPPGWQSRPPGWRAEPTNWQSQPPGWPPGTYGTPFVEAPRPGCVPLRPLGLGDILDGSFRMLRRNPRATLGLSALVGVIQVAISTAIQIFTLDRLGQVRVASAGDPTAQTNLGPVIGGEISGLAGVIVSLLLGAVLTGMLTHVITQDVLGVRVSFGAAWAKVRPRMWALIGLALASGILEALGLIPCLTVGIWLWGIWAVAVPALIVEECGVRKALGRSRQLVSGTFWRVWGIRALGAVMVTAASSVVSAPFAVARLSVSGTTGHVPLILVLLTAVATLVVTTFTAPIRAGIDALLYVDLRMRKEGLDIVLRQAATVR
ncbi:MAG TPA: hypothetical protein VK816_04420 [Jatrophihabitantaceae bacterium]|nr:hypothetical protein [Jatrophihabitantaceae bacterium]